MGELMISVFVGSGLLILASSIAFCFRLLARLSEMAQAMVLVSQNLNDFKARFEDDSKARGVFDLERAKSWNSIHQGTERLLEMHRKPDQWGFGTAAALEALAEGQKQLVKIAQNGEKMVSAMMQMQRTQRWIIENSNITTAKLPPDTPDLSGALGG